MKVVHKGSTAQIIVIVVLVIALVAVLGYLFLHTFAQKEPATFAECKQAPGSVLQESYPEQCRTKSGKLFTNPDQKVSNATEESNGTITGKAGYPSEGLPSDLTACAENSSDISKTYCTPVNQTRSDLYGVFSITVPASGYYVYAKTSSMGDTKAYYNEFVRCGLAASCAESTHSQNILVTVTAGATVHGIEPNDWYK